MRDLDAVAIIRNHRRDSLGFEDGSLSNERAKAMDHYHGRPYGNEEEGRSAVVSKDLSETVDWAMPAILRIFTQSGNVVEFEPFGPEDEDGAQQESDYTNQVVMKDNNGFIVLHDMIKDALLLKNGYVKHYWEETEKIEEEYFTGISMEEIAIMMQQHEQDGSEVEISGQEEKTVMVPDMMGNMIPMPVFDIKIKVKRKVGKCVLEAVPCEEVRVSKRCRGSLQDSPFTEHVTRKTRTDLIEMGMEKEFVKNLPAYNERVSETEALARDSVTDESTIEVNGVSDSSMDEIEFCEAYIRIDWDGDGIAELRKIVTCADQIPPGEEWNEPICAVPITGCVPKRVPHRHVGESLDDDLADLQEIKTTLLRQLFDNIYLTNNNQWLVNERVNLQDFMQSLPGGIKRVRGMEPVAGAVTPVVTQPIIGQVLPAIDYVDSLKEGRTGISKTSTGLDPDVLKQSTKGAFMENLNRASQKVEMIARMIAETGVKEMVQQVHGILRRHQDKARMIRLRGKWVQVNPTEWKERTDLTALVGLGTGNEEEKRSKLMLAAQMQDRLVNFGLVDAPQAFSLFADLMKAMGFDVPEKHALSPDSHEYQQRKNQPPPPPPELIIAQERLKADAQKFQAETQIDQQKFQAQAEIDERQAQQEMMREQQRSQNDITIEREKMMMQAELERYKAQLKAETELKIAAMNVQFQQFQPGAA